MSLRPRYSLLTLLVLTALVAGGVKLWYGPHHVVERPATDVEVEYTYTRDWQGKKNYVGPWIRRKMRSDKLTLVEIGLWKNNVKLNWVFQSEIMPIADKSDIEFTWGDVSPCPLTQLEKEELQKAADNEKRQIEADGYRFDSKYFGTKEQTPF